MEETGREAMLSDTFLSRFPQRLFALVRNAIGDNNHVGLDRNFIIYKDYEIGIQRTVKIWKLTWGNL